MSSKENTQPNTTFDPSKWIDDKFVGFSEEYFQADGFHYRAGRFCTTDMILVERWKEGDTVREAVNVEELPEGIQNQIKAAFA